MLKSDVTGEISIMAIWPRSLDLGVRLNGVDVQQLPYGWRNVWCRSASIFQVKKNRKFLRRLMRALGRMQ